MIGVGDTQRLIGDKMKKFFVLFVLLIFIFTGCTAPVKPDGLGVPSSAAKEPVGKTVYMCEDAENGYYYEETSSGFELYGQNKSSRDIKLIRSEDYIYNLVLSDSMLYFIGSDQNICRVKNTGDDYSVVLQASSLQKYDNEPVWGFCIVDDLLFIQMSFEFYRYDLKKKEIKKVCDDARNIGQSGDDVYFSGREGTIFKMNARSGETSALLRPAKTENGNENPKNLYKNFVFVDDVMYYYKRNPDGLYRYRSGESTLIDENSDINEASLFRTIINCFMWFAAMPTSLCSTIRQMPRFRLRQYSAITAAVREFITDIFTIPIQREIVKRFCFIK